MGENKNWSRAGKIASRMAQLWQRVTSHPVELIVLLHATVAAMVNGSSWWQQPTNYAAFAVTAAFSLSFYRTRWWAKAGYWGVLPLYALCMLLPQAWSGSAEFGILTALLPAVYMLTRCKADTEGFNARFFSLMRSMAVALCVGGLAFLLLMLIEESVWILFSPSWWKYHNITTYIAIFCYVMLAPMVFIGMESSKEPFRTTRLEEALVNWLLTPILLIYNVVLYGYIIVIATKWELPEASVATMVSAFMVAGVAIGWLRPMLKKQPIAWYFRWFGIVALPLIVLFWVSTGYRIGQYGMTMDRCLLVAIGALMTVFAALTLLKRRWETGLPGLWVVYIVAGLVLALGGPLSARQVSLRSQTKIVRQCAERLGILTDDGTMELGARNEADTTYRADHRRLYQAMKYIEQDVADSTAVQQRFGITTEKYLDHLSKKTADYATAYWINPDEESINEVVEKIITYSVKADRAIEITDIEGYSKMYTNLWLNDGKINIGGTTLDADSVLAVQLAKIGYTLESNLDRDKLNRNSNQLCTYRSADGRLLIVFEYFHIECREDGNHMVYGNIDCALIKE